MESGIIKIDASEINFGNIPLTSDVRHQTSHIANHVRPFRIERYNFASEKPDGEAKKIRVLALFPKSACTIWKECLHSLKMAIRQNVI